MRGDGTEAGDRTVRDRSPDDDTGVVVDTDGDCDCDTDADADRDADRTTAPAGRHGDRITGGDRRHRVDG
ncbi:hypothetical protein [Curtobacterium sp. 24E2]|nr:hypothetical protein JN350_04285 [Curtobacterium sp. 24E2]